MLDTPIPNGTRDLLKNVVGKGSSDDVDDCFELCSRQRIQCAAFARQLHRLSLAGLAGTGRMKRRRGDRCKRRWWSVGRARSNTSDLVIEVAPSMTTTQQLIQGAPQLNRR